MKTFCQSLLLLQLIQMPAMAQDDIETDRPDETETPSIVPVNHFQVENGFTHQQVGNDWYELAYPSTLFKLGLTEYLELRLLTELAREKDTDNVQSGLKPVTLGVKINLWKEKRLLPNTSLLLHAQIPTLASQDFKEKHAAPEIRMLFDNKVNKTIDLGYNLGIEWDGDTSLPTYEYTFSPNFKLSDKMKAFVEAFGYMPQHDHPDHWVDGGLLFLITKNVQVDVAAGYEISAHNHYYGYFETVGISFRI